MKGDFSRFTFDRSKHYTGVRLQQGRVHLDADWNEQLDIAAYLRRTLARDLIGASGAPANGGGFEIKVANNRPVITPGRYWVDGFLCENDAGEPLPIDEQLDLPGFVLPGEAGWYLAYLDVWEREVTALDDSDLQELALGGPDTTTRTRTVWQVRLIRVGDPGMVIANCSDVLFPPPSLTAPQLTLVARTRRPPEENQLYRVEVHTPGGLGTATFKWARDNGAVAARIEPPGADPNNPNKLVIVRQIQGGTFEAGQWIEVTDKSRLLEGSPGVLVQLATVSGQELSVVAWPGGGGAPALSDTPIVRRWDSTTAGGEPVVQPVVNDGFIPLEEGLEIRFGGPAGATLRTGDHWTIPVRAAAGALWPQTGSAPDEKLPDGIEHHHAPLSLLELTSSGWTVKSTNCRKSFEPSVTGIGAAKVKKSGDEMTGNLDLIDADLTVQGDVTIGKPGVPGAGKLKMLDAHIEPSTGAGLANGIRFPELTSQSAKCAASILFFGDPLASGSQVASPRLLLGATGDASIVLRAGAKDALTVNKDNVVIGVPPVTPDTHRLQVEGGALFRSGTGVVIQSSLTLTDGSQKAGRFLVSDANGRATWQDAAQSIGAPVFLPQRLFVGNGNWATGWIRYVLPSDKVPANVRAVILEAEAAKAFPDSGIIDAYIWIRRGPDEPINILLRGRSAGPGDVIAWANQGTFPVKSDNSFEYLITESGFDGGWAMNVVGYFP